MWPCRDTMKHISHLGKCPLERLLLQSSPRIYHRGRMYPCFASVPSWEIILGARWLGPDEYHPCWCCFVLQTHGLLRSEVSVYNNTSGLNSQECGHSAFTKTVSLPAATHHPHSALVEGVEQRCTTCFPQQPFQFTQSDTPLREHLQCSFHV